MLLVRLGSCEIDLPRAFEGLSDRVMGSDACVALVGGDKLTDARFGLGDDKRRLRCTEDLIDRKTNHQNNSQKTVGS